MKVLILGSGVIGVTSAYYLARAGHEVTVVDRQPEPALETSFANAGEVSPGYSSPWAGPGVPVKAIKWLLMKHGPLVIRPKLDPVMWVWLAQDAAQLHRARYAVNKSRMIPIAEYSRDCLRDLRRDIGIQYDERSQGTLQLFRHQAQLDGTGEDIAVLKQYGVPYEVLDREGCIAAEPALAAREGQDRRRAAPAAGRDRRLPHVHAGAGRACRRARRALHVQHRHRPHRHGWRARQWCRDQRGHVAGRRLCVALGSWSPRLLRRSAFRIPVYPVKGYSITVPIKDASGAPESTVMDESYKVAITRLGNRIRVGGTAEISGYSEPALSTPAAPRSITR